VSTTYSDASAVGSSLDYTKVTHQAVALYNRGDYRGAAARLEEMARINPNNIKIHEVLVESYLRCNAVAAAEHEMTIVRRLASKLYPELTFPDEEKFDDLVAAATAIDDLEERYRKLVRWGTADELLESMDVATQLSVKLMAEGRLERAEQVLVKYGDLMVALRESACAD